MAFLENYKLMMIPVYKITNRELVSIEFQWLPMATNNLLITNHDCYKLVKTNTLFYNGKTLAIGTMHW